MTARLPVLRRLRDRLAQAGDMARLLPGGGPACCNIAVTNVCNANCGFCGYARDKLERKDHRWIDADAAIKGLDILYARGIRYITFTGGEPTLHPRITELIAAVAARRMRPTMVTNGYTLSTAGIAQLAAAGLRTAFISVDAPQPAAHEENRGLKGSWARIRAANGELHARGVETIASVTLSKLVDDFDALIAALDELGFTTVTFAYPKRELHSSSLVFSADSPLVDWRTDELIAAFEAVRAQKSRFGVLNPDASLAEMIGFLRGERQRFECFGGYKYFLMDWDLKVYRCDFWSEPMGTIWEFADTPFIRDGCTRCMSDCYRDSSVYLGLAVALGDAIGSLRRGHIVSAVKRLASEPARASAAALWRERRTLRRHVPTGIGQDGL
jgi:MoaA/NifB/PqqE/SkfB family radical SAM enzyme